MQLRASVSPLMTKSRGAAEHAPCITSIRAPSSWALGGEKLLQGHPQASLLPQGHPRESHQQPLPLHWVSLLPGFPILSCLPQEKPHIFC